MSLIERLKLESELKSTVSIGKLHVSELYTLNYSIRTLILVLFFISLNLQT